jgi:hypothetical protein
MRRSPLNARARHKAHAARDVRNHRVYCRGNAHLASRPGALLASCVRGFTGEAALNKTGLGEMQKSYPLMFGLGLAAWAALLLVIVEAGKAASLW